MRKRRAITILISSMVAVVLLGSALIHSIEQEVTERAALEAASSSSEHEATPSSNSGMLALEALDTLAIKGRAPKTGYERSQFGNGWGKVQGCSVRNIILYRDLTDVVLDGECVVASGVLHDTYSGERIEFTKANSTIVQIDHVIALSDAWQKGAQQLTKERRVQLANDPLELIAVSGAENQAKSDADAASWLPKNKGFRCAYVARQIAVKVKYTLWVTEAEKEAMERVLKSCPNQTLPTS